MGVWTVRTEGWRADLCPVCHVVHRFKVVRHGNAPSVRGIPLGGGFLYRYEAICDGCGWTRAVEPEAAQRLAPERVADVRRLLAETNPDLVRTAARELDLARRLQAGGLTDDERQEMIRDVFSAATTFAANERTAQESEYRSLMRIRFVVAPIVLFFLIVLLALAFGIPMEWYLPLLLAIIVLVPVGMIYASLTWRTRFAKNMLRPLLLRGLGPLRPTQAEIAECVRRHRRTWEPYARALRGLAGGGSGKE